MGALVKAKVLVLICGAPFFLASLIEFTLLKPFGDSAMMICAAIILIIYASLAASNMLTAKVVIKFKSSDFYIKPIRAICLGWALLCCIEFLPVPMPSWALTASLGAALGFIVMYLAAIYFLLGTKPITQET